ncbi:MAG TPA: hypothetical protein VEL03_17620 [Streptosporangiaceae bacterium]|nr:hypothetical protein [Streptosporangiaceae bacterium]
MDNVAPRRDAEVLARKLADARRRLSQMDLPAGVTERLHRQFIAICDALKVPEADAATGLRRLSAFLSTLEQAVSKSSRNKSLKDKSTS